jgi:hypothetical protein
MTLFDRRRDKNLLRSDVHVRKEDSYLGPLLNQNDSMIDKDTSNFLDITRTFKIIRIELFKGS